MAAPQAVGVTHRREIAASDDPTAVRAKLADRYAAEHLGAANAASDGHVDEVITPSSTRERLAATFDLLSEMPRTARTARNLPL
jgi:acetyl-CoA carboxylase carboxyltransferase component